MVAIKTIGRVLKERRTELGLGLSEAESFTKIQKLYIVALETDDYKALPGEFYVKAYLKQYADKLGLDADKILEAYEAGKGITVEDKNDIQETYRFVKPSERLEDEAEAEVGPRDWHYYVPIITLSGVAIVIVLAVILAVVLNNPKQPDFLSSDYSYSKSDSSTKKSEAKSEVKNTSKSATQSSSASNKLTVTGSANTLTATLSDASSPVTIEFKDNGQANAWVLVRNSDMDTGGVTVGTDNPTVSATLASGVTQSVITLGNHTNITMTINGQAVDLTQFSSNGGPYNVNLTVSSGTATSTSSTDGTTATADNTNTTTNTTTTTSSSSNQ